MRIGMVTDNGRLLTTSVEEPALLRQRAIAATLTLVKRFLSIGRMFLPPFIRCAAISFTETKLRIQRSTAS